MEDIPENAIAVVGMACRFPGADSVAEYWELLQDGKTLDSDIPNERFNLTKHWRDPSSLAARGNFLKDIDAFDHKFFKIPSREAASMDPQQRLLLEVSYQALESAGYFGRSWPSDVGCYIGGISTDYNDNVASNPTNAFSALGSLKGFQSGRISHYFRWTGPSITYDTVCSSSGVAVDAACKAIRVGDCSSAIAGGVSLFTSPFFYQNLAASSFLSPQGRTTPFDEKADGYCRGEGVGLVVLKPLATAVQEGDPILGVIRSSCVQQSTSPQITRPHAASQRQLYQRLLNQARLLPEDVSYIEAHGTGTRVGDSPECDGICQVFGGEKRKSKLHFASVKGNIGHAEGASGIASLIKVILMIQHSEIPAQAGLDTLHPNINMEGQNISIPVKNQRWTAIPHVAVVNNFGAAGSICGLVVSEPPKKNTSRPSENQRFPVCLNSHTDFSLRRYCGLLLEYISTNYLDRLNTPLPTPSIADICFTLALRANRALPVAKPLVVSSNDDLAQNLQRILDSDEECSVTAEKTKPVVLVFGGQTTRWIHVPRKLFDTSDVFRSHLQSCDNALRAMKRPGILPEILFDHRRENTITLQVMQFALQYACARSWIDCNLRVECLLGHSLGQLAALTVAGVLSLEDGLEFISGRAALINEVGSSEKGGMVSVKADIETTESIIYHAKQLDPLSSPEVACYNGPNSHVMAGTLAEVQLLETVLANRFPRIKYKRLDVSHGFHSRLVEPILDDISSLASRISIRSPSIPIELCCAHPEYLCSESLARHTRDPVYFGNAVSRIRDCLGPCTWLEAGARSSVVGMARSALPADRHSDTFCPIELDESNHSITSTTAELWSLGYSFSSWQFHRSKSGYRALNLPPYQFEKARHWLEWKPNGSEPSSSDSKEPTQPELLVKLRSLHKETIFQVGTDTAEWNGLVGGHKVQQTPVCPASLYIELVMRAVRSVTTTHRSVPRIDQLRLYSPLGICEGEQVKLVLEDTHGRRWKFSFQKESGALTVADGMVLLPDPEETHRELSRAQRLINVGQNLFEPSTDSTLLHQPLIYRLFSQAITYGLLYHAISTLRSNKCGIQAEIKAPYCEKASGHSPSVVLEAVIQTAGFHANVLLSDCQNVFVCASIESVMVTSEFSYHEPDHTWTVILTPIETGNSTRAYDLFVLSPASQAVVMMISAIHFRAPSVNGLSRAEQTDPLPTNTDFNDNRLSPNNTQLNQPVSPAQASSGIDLLFILSTVTGIRADRISSKTGLLDLGIDSLLLTEIHHDILEQLHVSISMEKLRSAKTVADLYELVDCASSPGSEDSECPTSPSTPPSSAQSEQAVTVLEILSRHLEVPDSFDPCWTLEDLGADSLLCMELASDLNECSSIRNQEVSLKTQLRDLLPMTKGNVSPERTPPVGIDKTTFGDGEQHTDRLELRSRQFSSSAGWSMPPQEAVARAQQDFPELANEAGCRGFWRHAYPAFESLLQAYVLEAFGEMSIQLGSFSKGQRLPDIPTQAKYSGLLDVLLEILRDTEVINFDGRHYIRSDKDITIALSSEIHEHLRREFPQYTLEVKLLGITGPRLASFMLGHDDPLKYLFGNPQVKKILEALYTESPLFLVMTKLLVRILRLTLPTKGNRPVHILEIGAGVGGTTSWVIESLKESGINFHYTYTDISPSLVGRGKQKFTDQKDHMEFTVLDVESPPPPELTGRFDIVLSSLCIHATRNLAQSLRHIHQLLRPDGFVALTEFTRRIPWLDLVFGLLDGWWRFDDGRRYPLAPLPLWKKNMRMAGFDQVLGTGGRSPEAQTAQVICGFKSQHHTRLPPSNPPRLCDIERETICFEDETHLRADIYYPPNVSVLPSRTWPVALLIHGGGHIMLSRKSVPSNQVSWLLDQGILPISIDYRLCPEVTLVDGPIQDVNKAYTWARTELPDLKLRYPNIKTDGSKVGVVGWSSGGMLALSLGWTSEIPPEVVLAFYCPTDYEDEYWKTPHSANLTGASSEWAETEYDLLEGVQEGPISSFPNPAPITSVKDWMCPRDPRARIFLHMIRHGQTLPVLCRGLPSPTSPSTNRQIDIKHMPQPDAREVRKFNPMDYIRNGTYKTPTFFVHGRSDSFIPWTQSQVGYEALIEQGVPTGTSVLDGEGHLFDQECGLEGTRWEGCREGYEFLRRRLL